MVDSPDSPRLCLLTETYYPVVGGGETQSRVLARGLSAAGMKVTMLTRRTDRKLRETELIDGVEVRRLRPVGAGHLRKWGLCLTALWELLRRRKDIDVILVCGYRVLGIPAMILSLFFGKPCILKADSLGEYSGRFFDPGLSRFGLRHDRGAAKLAIGLRNLLLRRAWRFVAISKAVIDELEAGGIRREKISWIPNSVDVDVFKPVDKATKNELRAHLGIAEGVPVAVFTGRLERTKGLPLLLRVWRRIVSDHPDAVLVLVGCGGLGLQNCEAELRKYTVDESLQNNVLFTGSVENVVDYLQAADLFVFPSHRESFGISVAEAMACGLPVVATDIEGLSDVIIHGETAMTVPVNDGDRLCDAVSYLLQNPAAQQSMGLAGRHRAERNFSETRIIDKYLELIRSLTQSNQTAAT